MILYLFYDPVLAAQAGCITRAVGAAVVGTAFAHSVCAVSLSGQFKIVGCRGSTALCDNRC
jgi:hypothetical protein